MHLDLVAQLGLNNREIRDILPIPFSRIDRTFSALDEFDLRTTALDVVGVKIA
ncbi:MAG: hypothetical protein ACRD8U_00315 [Pyrinomonadaceae bacterium]